MGGTFDTSQCDSGRQSSTALKVLDQENHQLVTSIKKVNSQLKETSIRKARGGGRRGWPSSVKSFSWRNNSFRRQKSQVS